MNPLTNMKNVKKLSEQDLHLGGKSSWHDQYRNSAWIFVGGLPYDLTEGDVICIFSQYGEIVNINLVRDKDTGKSKGFCFICYEDQRSTNLAVDNFNGIKVLNRTIRVDHVEDYKIPKDNKKTDEVTKQLYDEGCAPKAQPIIPVMKTEPKDERIRETLAEQIDSEMRLPPRLPIFPVKKEKLEEVTIKKEKKDKKKEKKKNKKKKSKRAYSSSSSDESDSEKDISRKKQKDRKSSSSHHDAQEEQEKTEKSLKYKQGTSSHHRSESADRNEYRRRDSRSQSPSKDKGKSREKKRSRRTRSRSDSGSRRRRSRSADRDKKYFKYK